MSIGTEIAKRAERLIMEALHKSLIKAADDAVKDAIKNKEFTSFTGQTVTSYFCGVYLNGVLTDVVRASSSLKAPVHSKIRKGQRIFLSNPYEGPARAVKGRVDVSGDSGAQASMNFLLAYPIKGQSGLILTTGTEYSAYLESVRNLNVLSQSVDKMGGFLFNNLTPIK